MGCICSRNMFYSCFYFLAIYLKSQGSQYFCPPIVWRSCRCNKMQTDNLKQKFHRLRQSFLVLDIQMMSSLLDSEPTSHFTLHTYLRWPDSLDREKPHMFCPPSPDLIFLQPPNALLPPCIVPSSSLVAISPQLHGCMAFFLARPILPLTSLGVHGDDGDGDGDLRCPWCHMADETPR